MSEFGILIIGHIISIDLSPIYGRVARLPAEDPAHHILSCQASCFKSFGTLSFRREKGLGSIELCSIFILSRLKIFQTFPARKSFMEWRGAEDSILHDIFPCTEISKLSTRSPNVFVSIITGPCKDEIDYCDGFSDQCAWDANSWMWMGRECRKSCSKCGMYNSTTPSSPFWRLSINKLVWGLSFDTKILVQHLFSDSIFQGTLYDPDRRNREGIRTNVKDMSVEIRKCDSVES